MSEGRTQEFTGYSDGYEVGDVPELRGYFTESKEHLVIRFSDEKRNKILDPSFGFHTSNIFFYDDRSFGFGRGLRFKEGVKSKGSGRWDEDYLDLEYVDSFLGLNRYYKSDWDGLLGQVTLGLPRYPKHLVHLTSLDCRTLKNDLPKLILRFKDKSK